VSQTDLPTASSPLPPPLRDAVRDAVASLAAARVPQRVWERDPRVWSDDPREISDRLGWLDVARGMRPRLPEIQAWTDSLLRDGVADVVLLGMGGSSLAPEVFRRTFPAVRGRPALHVLDSTSPHWIRRVGEALDPARAHFLVASKSGTTLEVETLFAHFRSVVERSGAERWADRFTAITDPDTPLAKRAQADAFRAAFLNPADIGGRFSALSLFGLVPASIVGADLSALLSSADAMALACGPDVAPERNPGVVLGALLGAGVRAGRDKMTLLTAEPLASFGLWVEQLLAESTGKEGTGVVPVVDEPDADAPWGEDRLVVAVGTQPDADPALERRVDALRRGGLPVFRTWTGDLAGLGGEMFRWELATAVAGHLLGIHPFDQPDVQSAKTRTSEILAALARGARRAPPEPGDARAALASLRPGEWVGLMVYGDPSEALGSALAALRRAVRKRSGAATTLGLGPRFLHSTGQLHKGGANRGVFLQIVLPEESLPIPGRPWGFRELMEAQADGDLAALRERGRRAARVTVGDDPVAAVRALAEAVAG
jgi:glucose-6-phosphate isomerase/transaldolase/glucose-6-phosphate isomerase